MPFSFYERLSKKPEMFRSFSGLDVAEFDSLLSRIKLAHDDHEKKRLSRRDRKNKIGAGHPFKLSLEDRLLMLLMYYRSYVTSILLGFAFSLDQSNVLKDIRMLEPLVKECIPLPEKLHEMVRRARTIEEVERYFPGFRAFVDSTEDAKSFGGTGSTGGARSDTIMLVRVDPKSHHAWMLSFPRDLWLPIAPDGHLQRINTAFDTGPQNLIDTIKSDWWGITSSADGTGK